MAEPISATEKAQLSQLAIDCSLLLGKQLFLLLDAYDFCQERYPANTPSELFKLHDVQVSIGELGKLPYEVSTWLSNIRNGHPNMVSIHGFELNVLVELAMHAHCVAIYVAARGVDLQFDLSSFSATIKVLRDIARKLG